MSKESIQVLLEGWKAPLLIADCGTKRAPELVEEQCANAQAIAALPELLEALKEANFALSHLPHEYKRSFESLFLTIDAALAKAGEVER